MTTTSPERRTPRRRYFILREAMAIVDYEIERRILKADGAMDYINTTPKIFTLGHKQEVVSDLNWAFSMVPEEVRPGRFFLAKYKDEDDDDCVISLKSNDDQT